MIGLIDVGGTKLLAAVARPDGTTQPSLSSTVRHATPRQDPIETMAAMLDEARAGEPLSAIAMAVPGPFDRAAARLLNPPGLNGCWWNLDLRGELGERFSCPVVAENDANCAALAEARVGAGRGYRDVVYITVSTGIGAGQTRDGQLVIARHDTEAGHMVLWPRWLDGPACDCGGHGCLEALASGRAILQRFGQQPEQLDDQNAWDEVGAWLGLAVTNITAVSDPDVVIFGGGVCQRWERFSTALQRTVDETLFLQPKPVVVRAELGEDRNLHGALALIVAAADVTGAGTAS